MVRPALALVSVAAVGTSTSITGRSKFAWLVTLKASQRNWTRDRSWIMKFFMRDRLTDTSPGPSRTLRPELPHRNAPVGAGGNAARLNQSSGEGLSSRPFAIRFGRFASPWFRFTLATGGGNGWPE